MTLGSNCNTVTFKVVSLYQLSLMSPGSALLIIIKGSNKKTLVNIEITSAITNSIENIFLFPILSPLLGIIFLNAHPNLLHNKNLFILYKSFVSSDVMKHLKDLLLWKINQILCFLVLYDFGGYTCGVFSFVCTKRYVNIKLYVYSLTDVVTVEDS